MRWLLISFILLVSCDKAPLLAPVELATPAVAVFKPTPIPDDKTDSVVALPETPNLSPKGHILVLESALTAQGNDLILEFETGGRKGYNPRPEWPGAASGVTIGIGYDIGYSSKSVFLSDWAKLNESARNRLAEKAGITGKKARAQLHDVLDIIVQWNMAIEVFDVVDVSRWFAACRKAFPGFDELRPNAQAVLVSLGFNRGLSMVGPNRVEMRAIKALVPQKDYAGMAKELRTMIRIWKGTDIENGMRRRRLAEAKLMETT